MKKLLQNLFSIRNEVANKDGFVLTKHKVITILGVKLKKKILTKDLMRPIIQANNRLEFLSRKNDNLLRLINLQRGNVKVWEDNNPRDFINNPNIKNLYNGLSEEATKNLNKILERNRKVTQYYDKYKIFPNINNCDIFDEEDRHDFEKNYNFYECITVFERASYYYDKQRKKGRVITEKTQFEPCVEVDKHGLDFLTNKNIGEGAILDIGAFDGCSSIMFREEFPENEIIAFEPQKDNFLNTKQNFKLNKMQNASIINLALGDEKGSITITNSGGGSRVGEGDEITQMDTLDNFVNENNLKVALIKIDIEGAEQAFLKGAVNTIQKQAPVMLLSIYHNIDDFCKIKPTIEKLMENSKYYYTFDFHQMLYPHGVLVDCMLLCEPHLK